MDCEDGNGYLDIVFFDADLMEYYTAGTVPLAKKCLDGKFYSYLPSELNNITPNYTDDELKEMKSIKSTHFLSF
ncbi:MAG: hypothetical protein R2836_05520 [Chitinophagales bacterium]